MASQPFQPGLDISVLSESTRCNLCIMSPSTGIFSSQCYSSPPKFGSYLNRLESASFSKILFKLFLSEVKLFFSPQTTIRLDFSQTKVYLVLLNVFILVKKSVSELRCSLN